MIQYCMSVLLYEAVLQLILWRSGARQSYELLSPDEEEVLHALAINKSLKSYWVHDIINLRRIFEGAQPSNGAQGDHAGSNGKATSGGTRSRPRKAV